MLSSTATSRTRSSNGVGALALVGVCGPGYGRSAPAAVMKNRACTGKQSSGYCRGAALREETNAIEPASILVGDARDGRRNPPHVDTESCTPAAFQRQPSHRVPHAHPINGGEHPR